MKRPIHCTLVFRFFRTAKRLFCDHLAQHSQPRFGTAPVLRIHALVVLASVTTTTAAVVAFAAPSTTASFSVDIVLIVQIVGVSGDFIIFVVFSHGSVGDVDACVGCVAPGGHEPLGKMHVTTAVVHHTREAIL